jgi:hypothetical protein
MWILPADAIKRKFMIVHKQNFASSVPLGHMSYGTLFLYNDEIYMPVDESHRDKYVAVRPIRNATYRHIEWSMDLLVIPIHILEVTVAPGATFGS